MSPTNARAGSDGSSGPIGGPSGPEASGAWQGHKPIRGPEDAATVLGRLGKPKDTSGNILDPLAEKKVAQETQDVLVGPPANPQGALGKLAVATGFPQDTLAVMHEANGVDPFKESESESIPEQAPTDLPQSAEGVQQANPMWPTNEPLVQAEAARTQANVSQPAEVVAPTDAVSDQADTHTPTTDELSEQRYQKTLEQVRVLAKDKQEEALLPLMRANPQHAQELSQEFGVQVPTDLVQELQQQQLSAVDTSDVSVDTTRASLEPAAELEQNGEATESDTNTNTPDMAAPLPQPASPDVPGPDNTDIQKHLDKSEDYQKALKEFETIEKDTPDTVKQIADMPTEASDPKDHPFKEINEKDGEINALSPEQKKLYDQFVNVREYIEQVKNEAALDVEEAGIDSLPAEQQANARRDVEARRRESRQKSYLQRNARYQDLQRKWRTLEQRALSDTYGMSVSDLRDLAVKNWSSLSPTEKHLFGGDTDEAKKAFQKYQRDKSDMNKAEGNAKVQVFNERRDKENHKEDGTAYSTDPKKRDEEVREEMKKESRFLGEEKDLGRIRRFMQDFGQGVDHWFGKAEMDEHGKQAIGYVKRLYGQYGWRGLFSQESDAKNLRKLAMEEAGEWATRWGLRKIPLFLLTMGLFWLVLPMVYGKALEITKPFGGNG